MGDISGEALHAVFSESGSRPATVSSQRSVMGGKATITVLGAGANVLDACFDELITLEKLWSRFLPDSDIMRLNWAEGKTLSVDHRTALLVNEMKEGYERTSGDFDPTILPNLITEGYEASLVDASRITRLPESAVAPGNVKGISIGDSVVTLPVGTTLDPGGVGKGLAADLVARHALNQGAWGVMVEVAGDIRVMGEAPDGVAWRLGVEDPFGHSENVDVVRLPDGGVVTSSQRKKRFGSSAEKHHLIDPNSKKSAQTSAQTVTVIAATAAKAETLTKPGFLRPIGEFLAWLPGVGAAGMVVDSSGIRHESMNWGNYR